MTPPRFQSCAIALCALISLVLTYSRVVNHDVSWLLYAVEQQLNGAELYVDLMGTNPPLIYYLLIPPVALAQKLDISVILSLRGYVILLATGTLFLCQRILYGNGRLAFADGLIAGLSATLLLLPGYDFAQREHLLMILLAPHLLVAARRANTLPTGRGVRPLAAVLAGLAICLKPQFVFMLVLVEAYVSIVRRSWKGILCRENWLIAGIGGLYLTWVHFVHPAYFTNTVPLLADTYYAYLSDRALLLKQSNPALGVMLYTIGLLLFRKDRTRFRIVMVLGLAGLGAHLGYLLQATTWRYHILPYYMINGTLMLCLAAFVIQQGTEQLGARFRISPAIGRTAGVVLATAVLLAVLGPQTASRLAVGWRQLTVNSELATQDQETSGTNLNVQRYLTENTSAEDGVYIFATTVMPTWPVVLLTNRKFASRWFTPWPLFAVARHQIGGETRLSPERIQTIEEYFVSTLVADLLKNQPKHLLIEVSRRKYHSPGVQYELFDFMRSSPQFERLMDRYELVDTLTHGRDFDVYRRKDLSSTVLSRPGHAMPAPSALGNAGSRIPGAG